MIYIKEYKIVLTDEISEFYENLSMFQKKPVEEILKESLIKNKDLMMTILTLSK